MQLHFFGGAKSVTGANYLLVTDAGTRLIVDVGMFQGRSVMEDLNYAPFPYDIKTITAVLLTHSHLDHCGRLPRLIREGYAGPIYCTPPTKDIIEPSLLDTAGIIAREAERNGYPPLFDTNDVKTMMRLVKTRGYEQPFDVAPDVRIRFFDAGHILGSASIEVVVAEGGKEKTIIFTGDLGNPPTPLLNPTTYPVKADYVVIESAYGDRLHEDRSTRKQLLRQVIIDAVKKKGVLLIPSFAIERTQELLYELNDLVEHHKIPRVPIFIDSPLAIKIIEAYRKNARFFNFTASAVIRSGDDIFNFPLLTFTRTGTESRRIKKIPSPKIIIAGAGMSTGGRIVQHEKEYISDPSTTVLIIGFQVEGSLGRKLLHKDPVVMIDGERVIHRAEVRAIGGYSAHADQQGLLKYIGKINRVRPKKVFIVQGEAKASEALAHEIREQLGILSVVPDHEANYDL